MLKILVIILIIPASLSREAAVFAVSCWVHGVIALQLEAKLPAKALVSFDIVSAVSFTVKRVAYIGEEREGGGALLGITEK